jgi:AraC-like DNA-binding protein
VAKQLDSISKWREEYARRVLSLDFEPLTGEVFCASFAPIFDLPRIVRASFSPGITFRDEELVKDGEDQFWLMISDSKSLNIAHQGRDLQLARGDATLMHVCETGRVGSHLRFGYTGVMVPHPEWQTRHARPSRALMEHLPRRSEALRILRGYIHMLEKRNLHLCPEENETVLRHIFDLVALAITHHGAIGESGLSAVKGARLNAALAHIAACFQEPGLSVAAVAESQGISTRYLQQLMESSGISFTAYVNELRLQRALTLLTGSGPERRIVDIALEVGFSDISHFNRLFRHRFGDSPSSFRK